MEYQDAPQNTRELFRNSKKLAKILRAFDVKIVSIRAQIQAVQSYGGRLRDDAKPDQGQAQMR